MSKKLQKVFAFVLFLSLLSCKKEISTTSQKEPAAVSAKAGQQGHLQQTKTFSSDVITRWITLQL
ncbi:MAG: hypothetical protein GXC73_15790, partial [Chitinophagaceae bacterium]|nr:hypothetical protein [Chitinophagaceae bacterium]